MYLHSVLKKKNNTKKNKTGENSLSSVQVPEIRDNLLRKDEGKWKKIAKQQMKFFFNPSDAEIREQARRLVVFIQHLILFYFV
jgi:hypothetical protein